MDKRDYRSISMSGAKTWRILSTIIPLCECYFSKRALLASYEVVHQIAQCKKKFHTIAEELILSAALDMVFVML